MEHSLGDRHILRTSRWPQGASSDPSVSWEVWVASGLVPKGTCAVTESALVPQGEG